MQHPVEGVDQCTRTTQTCFSNLKESPFLKLNLLINALYHYTEDQFVRYTTRPYAVLVLATPPC